MRTDPKILSNIFDTRGFFFNTFAILSDNKTIIDYITNSINIIIKPRIINCAIFEVPLFT